MDIQTAHSLIWNFLGQNDSYSVNDSYKLLNWKALQENGEKLDDTECKLAIILAFDDLLENGVVKKIEHGAGKNKDTTYIINESIKNSPVTIQISKETAEQVAVVVNSIIPFFTLDKVEPTTSNSLSEQSIILLLETIVLMKDQIEKNLTEIEGFKNKPKNKEIPPEPEI